MENGQIFLIVFGLFNLCLLLFCRQLSGLVDRFFLLGRTMGVFGVLEKKARKLGFSGIFSNPEIYNPSRKKLIQFLAWSGAINFLGCVVIYIIIDVGLVDHVLSEESDPHNSPARSESHFE